MSDDKLKADRTTVRHRFGLHYAVFRSRRRGHWYELQSTHFRYSQLVELNFEHTRFAGVGNTNVRDHTSRGRIELTRAQANVLRDVLAEAERIWTTEDAKAKAAAEREAAQAEERMLVRAAAAMENP